ncbi:hypothetical protein [Curtobacterium luteum]|uniref:hypothetical protein n=1 Tax=Curtobacterium luteum TaxID=33881 RepID=UPI00381F03D5
MNRAIVGSGQGAPATGLLAGAAAFVLVFKIPGSILFPGAALALALVVAPIVLARLASFAAGRALGMAAVVAVTSGLLLRATTDPTVGSPGSWGTAVTLVAWLLAVPAGVGLGWWAKDHLRPDVLVRVVLLGAVLSALLIERPFVWKGNTGVYLTLLALAVLPTRSRWATRSVLVCSAVVSAVSDARFMSLIAIIVLVATFVGDGVRRSVAQRPFLWVLVSVSGLVLLVQSALLAMRSGLLGSDIAARTIAQTSGGRSIVEGSRTEWAASLHLFSVQPWGIGLGDVVNGGLAREAIVHVQAVGGDYTSSYFLVDVFGQRTDLHSVLADLWYHFGVGGLAVAAVIVVVLVRALPDALALPVRPAAVALFTMATGAWDLFFSPMPESDRITLSLLVAALCTSGYFSGPEPGEHGRSPAQTGLSARTRRR